MLAQGAPSTAQTPSWKLCKVAFSWKPASDNQTNYAIPDQEVLGSSPY